MTEADPLLSVRDLEKHFPITEGILRRETGRVRAVDGVSFDVHPGEAFGVVGESGCGKSTTALSVLRLEEPTGGEVTFDGDSVRDYGRSELREYRRRAQLVLQDPNSALDPRRTVGEAVAEPLRIHGMTDGDRRRAIVEDTLERVGLAGDDADSYPHAFSGGEKQRIGLARALVLNPDLLIADEPVSALDGRTKAEVLELIADLQASFDLAVLFISHDVDVVRRFCDRVAVMYLGRIVERGPTDGVLGDPHHPYTRALLSSVPSLDPAAAGDAGAATLTDDLPDAADLPSGCRFHPRCPAIIPPAERSLPRQDWLGVVALRVFLADEWSGVDALRASLPDGDGDLDARLRSAFGLPDRLPDDDVERALEDAVGALADGDVAGASDRLASVTETVCERSDPSLTDATDREVACHHYDPDRPGDPDAVPAGERAATERDGTGTTGR